ncbi:hypothetical protein GCM10025881_03210 [Pseudolysinimonas kribbensis]|uniref:Tyr recombinase domain-containing protein n=1 Tax=Pseudolysinimonas kribbensis TaxID=433641 RepID=A0ABQ6K3R3_9MICO|nr:hypothetical protein GCM10025881_03210 [Pseudolysinimonas kribbensis]
MARALSSIRGFTRFLVEEGLLTTDPAVEVPAPKLPARLPKALTIEQVEALLSATDGDEPARLRDKALLELLYATGARVSEAVDLNVDDLIGEDGAADVIRLFGKGGKQRIVPVGSYARAALDAYLVRARPLMSAHGRATPALFLGVRGARLSRQNAWLIIRAAGSARSSAWSSRRTRCGTRSRPTCCRAERTCGWCRSCSATRAWRRRRSTRRSRLTRCATCTRRRTPAPAE